MHTNDIAYFSTKSECHDFCWFVPHIRELIFGDVSMSFMVTFTRCVCVPLYTTIYCSTAVKSSPYVELLDMGRKVHDGWNTCVQVKVTKTQPVNKTRPKRKQIFHKFGICIDLGLHNSICLYCNSICLYCTGLRRQTNTFIQEMTFMCRGNNCVGLRQSFIWYTLRILNYRNL